ncbi:hypothetical protein [Acidipila sp. EB88]|uniref:hypothetical protein n=1 Tax=Acidipila sp. EB88 TaxID=2305226 RepID=UPI000F5EE4E8|nr:hypothetical protein [Acidipila sp. EB88]RRA47596.1 hypothetical protein D1Y84_04095 [Acidipila sp. EB88]
MTEKLEDSFAMALALSGQDDVSRGQLAVRFDKRMALKIKLRAAREKLVNNSFLFTGWLVATLLPPSRWYRAVLAISRFLARSSSRFAQSLDHASSASLDARLLHRFLDILSNYKTAFHIPIVVEGRMCCGSTPRSRAALCAALPIFLSSNCSSHWPGVWPARRASCA